MLILIENGEIYAPEKRGENSILIAAGKILKVGRIDRQALETLHVSVDVIDASDCVVVPGLIDPHEHLLGGSGEKGFASQTPAISATELISAGITTVVGCLGVDTTMKTMPGLLAKAKGLKEENLSAFVWTGGYNVPPTTLSDSIKNDIMFIEEIIGAGEVAISDERSTDPEPHELARLASDARNGGMLAKKCGLTHFHVGEESNRLKLLNILIDEFKTPAESLYPTHIQRSEELMKEAIALAKRGSFVDIDTVDQDLAKWFGFYLENGGDLKKLTASSDASINSPRALFDQIRSCVLEDKFALEQALQIVTANTAAALKLENKGVLEAGKDADVLVLRKESLEIKDVIANGKRLFKNGRLAFKEKFLEGSNRTVNLKGD
jgi:beta-aspartyl-dipeptidase (metallo-type)